MAIAAAYSTEEEIEITFPPYYAEPTLSLFHSSSAFVRGVMGPLGSGKSSGCCVELARIAGSQEPFNGVRATRFGIVRNTYPELKSTTIKTFREWFPDEVCSWKFDSPISAKMRFPQGDGTILDAEFYFLSLDRPKDVRKLKSLEATVIWLNEASELAKEVLDMATSRVGRYPAKRSGKCTRAGVIMDTNAPDEDHWWYNLAEVSKPLDYEFFTQPPAMIKAGDSWVPNMGQIKGVPPAENINNLPMGWAYYEKLIAGKTSEWIKVYLGAQYGYVRDGKLVYPEYNDTIHCTEQSLEIFRGLPLILCFDFGLTPACVFLQITPTGQLRVLDELCSDYMGLRQFCKDRVKPYLSIKFPGMTTTTAYCDPAGSAGGQTDERSCIDELKSQGFLPIPALTNDFLPRRDSVANYLTKMVEGGKPGFIMSKDCKRLREGFLGGYSYARVQVTGEERYVDKPKKNKFSHCLAGNTMVMTPEGEKPIKEISVGDYVITPKGRQLVTATMNRKTAEILKIVLSNGREILCTPDHPFVIKDKIICADALKYGIILDSINTMHREVNSWGDRLSIKYKKLMESSFIGSLRDITRQTLKSMEHCTRTVMYGCATGGQFPTECACTTSTATNRTTIYQTCTLSSLKNIHDTTQKRVIWIFRGEWGEVSLLHKMTRKNGTHQERALSGTENTAGRHGKQEPKKNACVLFAKKLFMAGRVLLKRAFAQCHARDNSGPSLALMTLKEIVAYAAKLLRRTNILQKKPAVSVVQISCLAEPTKVFDLTVENEHCFYASGVLVGNCHDALQYGAMMIGGQTALRPRSQARQLVNVSHAAWS